MSSQDSFVPTSLHIDTYTTITTLHTASPVPWNVCGRTVAMEMKGPSPLPSPPLPLIERAMTTISINHMLDFRETSVMTPGTL